MLHMCKLGTEKQLHCVCLQHANSIHASIHRDRRSSAQQTKKNTIKKEKTTKISTNKNERC